MRGSLFLACLFVLAPSLEVAGSGIGAQAEKDLADAWANLGNWKRAVVHYQKALQLDPQLTEARLRLANGLYRLGDRGGALRHLEILQRKQPKSAAVAAAAGVIWLDAGRPAKACGCFARALQAAPKHARSLFGTGQCNHALFDRSKHERNKRAAVRHYQAYLHHHAKGAFAAQARESLDRLRLGETGRQLAEAREALASGKYRLAALTLRQVVAKRPDLQKAQYLLGMALASPVIDRIEEAARCWEKAPRIKQARLQLGILAYEDDRPYDAEEHLERAIELDPEFAEAYYHLGLICMQLVDDAPDGKSRLNKALSAFQRVLALTPKTRLAERAASKLQILTGRLHFLAESEVIDTAAEVELGRKLCEHIERQFGVADDERLQVRLNAILRKVAANSERLPGALPYRIRVLKVDGINALSLTGGTIYLFKGLIDFVRIEMKDSDDALATVIGHEVAHVDRRHGLGMLDLIGGAQSLMEGRSLTVRSLDSLMKGMSRRHEFEADQLGVLYAFRAGYNPAAAYRFHRRMIATGHEILPGLDHPTSLERAEQLKEYLLGLRAKARNFERGLRCIDRGEHEDAIRHLEIFLGVFPHNLPARNNLGVAMHRLAMIKRVGEHAYKLSTDVDPRSKVRRIGPLRDQKLPFSPDRALMIEAAELFRTIARRRPEYPAAWTNLGACLLALDQTDPARQAFERALAVRADDPEVQNNLAVVHLTVGEPQKGIALLERVVERHAQFADAYFNLAQAHLKAGDKDAARKMYLAYLARDDKSGWARAARERLEQIR